ncbi:MAG: NUDIX hydrolase [Tannerellaceae bacterium]
MKKEPKLWEVLSSDYLHNAPWCTLRRDSVKVSNGAIIPDYYILEYPNWINVIAITKAGKFLFIYQYRHGLQQYFYELTAGVCDATDQSPLETAQRELLEETGYGNGNWEQWSVLSANPSTHTNLCYSFLATDVEKISEQHLDAAEDLEVVELDLEEVKQLLFDDKIKQSLHAAALWKYMAVNKLI